MQKFFKFFMAIALLIGVGAMSACSDDPETDNKAGAVSFEVELTSVGAASADVVIRSNGIAKVAWVVGTQPINDRNLIFASENRVTITSKEQSESIGGMQPESRYVISFAAETTKGKFHDKVVSLEVTTTDFSDEYTLFDIDYRSAKIHIKFPEAVRERGNALKWGFCDFALYNNGLPDADKINGMQESFYKNYILEDHLFVLDNSDENILVDPSQPDYPLYLELYPNQDCYFMIGEYTYVDEENMGYWITDEDGDEIYVDFTNGFHEPGYYQALFDYDAWKEAYGNNQGNSPRSSWRATPMSRVALPDQSAFWHGYYRLINFRTKAPQLLDGKVNVDYSGLTPRGGELRLSPEGDGIAFYLVGIMHPNTWEEILQSKVKDPTDTADVQAYLTSYHAAINYGISYFSGDSSLNPASYITHPDSETDYVLVIIGMGNEEGTQQFFQKETFRLPESELTLPDATVEFIEELATTNSLSFRIKCPTQDAAGALYSMNLSREWDILLNKYAYPVEDVVYGYGEGFEAEEMVYINSEEGYVVEFRGLVPGMKYGFGGLCLNTDGFYGTGSYVEGYTLSDDNKPARVESPYFESLKGEWTLSATIAYKEYNSKTFEWIPKEGLRKSRVVIGDIVMPGLDAEDYDIASRNYYGAVSKEMLDQYYADIEADLPAYHASVRDQNYILCQGYDLYPWLYDRGFSSTDYTSPHDLLTDRYYPYYDTQTLFYEYGPKWYFEVGSDGSLSVPFNAYAMDPNYGFEGPYYLAGINSQSLKAASGEYSLLPAGIENGEWATGHFPVTFRDENTIVIEPVSYNGEKYYPHMVSISGGNFSIQSRIISEITLTRGWDEKDHPAYVEPETTSAASGRIEAIRVAGDSSRVKPLVRPRSVTKFDRLLTK